MDFWERGVNYLTSIRLADIIDILLVAYIIFRLIWVVRRTSMSGIAKGIGIFLLALWLSGILRLTMLNYLMRKAVEIGAIALLVIFQPELRKMLEKLGTTLSRGKQVSTTAVENMIMQTVLACNDLANSKTGALIVFERSVLLNDIISTGTKINSDVNAELLKNLFFNKAPLHDGAVIIRDNRINSAGCVLPLTRSTNLSKDLGMRHRAGLGMSEHSDAIVVIVSEETGAISVAIDGMLKRHLDSASLDTLLHNELVGEVEESRSGILDSLKKIFLLKDEEDDEMDKKNI